MACKKCGDPLKLVYDWIKQDHIGLKEAKELFAVAQKRI